MSPIVAGWGAIGWPRAAVHPAPHQAGPRQVVCGETRGISRLSILISYAICIRVFECPFGRQGTPRGFSSPNQEQIG